MRLYKKYEEACFLMDIKLDTVPLYMIIILLIVFLILFFLIIIEPQLYRKKLSNKNEHGSSKFATVKEIKQYYKKEELNNIEKAGLPVYYSKNKLGFNNVYFDNNSPHWLLIGSTGSGKSVSVSINMAIHFAIAKEKHSVVLTDPKGELFMSTSKIFQDHGYTVVTIDFRNPIYSDRINIMQPIINDWKCHCKYDANVLNLIIYFFEVNQISLSRFLDEEKYQKEIIKEYSLEDYLVIAMNNNKIKLKEEIKIENIYDQVKLEDCNKKDVKTFLQDKSNEDLLGYIKENQNKSIKYQAETNRLVITLANLIFAEKDSKDPFWINSAKQLFIGIVGIFLEDYKNGLIEENKINISSVKKFQNSSLIKENQNYLQRDLVGRQYGSLSKDYLTPILSAAENTYKSITAVFSEKMSIFDDLNVENITSVSDFTFTNVGKDPTALYIIVPDEDKTYFRLVTIILGMLIKDLTKYANLTVNNGVLPIKVEWLLDEFANCPPLDSIESTVSVARSRGMRFFFFIQSFNQLEQIYSKETAGIIEDNCALQYLKTNSIETAEIISKKLGKATIETNSLSMSTNPFEARSNKTKSLIGKELLTPTELIGLKYKTIIFPIFGHPIFRDTYMYSDIYPKYKSYGSIERQPRMLKRAVNNYYTVEDMKMCIKSKPQEQQNNMENIGTKELQQIQNLAQFRLGRNLIVDSKIIDDLINDIFTNCDVRVSSYKSKDVLVINKIINDREIQNLENYNKDNCLFSVSKNLSKMITKITVFKQ